MPSQGATLVKVAAVPGAINVTSENLAGTDIISLATASPISSQTTLAAFAAFLGVVPAGYKSRVVTTDAEAIVEPDDVALLVDKTISGPTTFLLPDPIIRENDDDTFLSRALIFLDMKGDAGTYPITLDAGVGNTINGAQTLVLDSNYAGVILTGESDSQWGVLVQTFGPTTAPRTKLTQDTTFFVATPAGGGNDANSGLIGFPKATIPAMLRELYEDYDFGGFRGTLQLADGQYTAGISIFEYFVGQNSSIAFRIQGNPANVLAVRIDVNTTAPAVNLRGGSIELHDVTITNSGASGDAIFVDELGFLKLGNIRIENVNRQMFFAGGGGHIFVFANKTITIAGSAQNFIHHTGLAEISFEDCFLNFIPNPGTGLDPFFSVYLIGGNNSPVSFNRCTITGNKAGCIVEHFYGQIKHATTSGNILSTFYAGQPANIIDTGGSIFYQPQQQSFYVGLAGNDLSEGYEAGLPVLQFGTCMTLMQKRWQSSPLQTNPIMQVNDGTYSGSIVLLDIPGASVATLRGNPTTPANCAVISIQNRATDTQWIIDGFTMTAPGADCFHGNPNSKTSLQNVVFNTASNTSAQITVDQNGYVESTGPLFVTGDAGYFISCAGGQVVITDTVTFTGARTYALATVLGASNGNIRWTGTKTVSVSVTATRVNLTTGAFLNSNNSTSQLGIPGSVDGPVDAGSFATMI